MTVLHSVNKDKTKQIVIADAAGNTISLDGATTILLVVVDHGAVIATVTRPAETIFFTNPAMISVFDKEET